MRGDAEDRHTDHEDQEQEEHRQNERQREVEEADDDAGVRHPHALLSRALDLARAMKPVMIATTATVNPPTTGMTCAKNDARPATKLTTARLLVGVVVAAYPGRPGV